MLFDLPARKAAPVARSRNPEERNQPLRQRRANQEAIKMIPLNAGVP